MKPYIFKVAFSAFLFMHTIIASAQVAAVKFIVHTPAVGKDDMRVYIAGSFNYWHEGDSLYRMNKIGNDVYGITIPVFEAKQYNYKYTLGTWSKVEVALNDSDISNRSFISLNGKSITDTVMKWKQPNTKVTDSSVQLKRIVAMKDSITAKLKPELAELLGMVKLYAQNMLQEKPDMSEHQRLDKKALEKFGNIYSAITGLIWNVCASLSPEQKQQISKTISQPANGDFLNSFLGAINAAVK
jgi:hypothetical protein